MTSVAPPRRATAATRGWSPSRAFALASAAVYLGAGLVGFAVTGIDAPFTGPADTKVVILAINPLHNVIHLVLGACYALGAASEQGARYANVAIGAGLLGAFVLGVAGGGAFLNITSIGEPDNWLHLIWGLASVTVGLAAAGVAARRS